MQDSSSKTYSDVVQRKDESKSPKSHMKKNKRQKVASGKPADWLNMVKSLREAKANQELIEKAKVEKERLLQEAKLAKEKKDKEQLAEMQKQELLNLNKAIQEEKRNKEEDERKKQEKERMDKEAKEKQKEEDRLKKEQDECDRKGCFTETQATYLIRTYFGDWNRNGETDDESLKKFNSLQCKSTFGELLFQGVETMCEAMDMKNAKMFTDAGSARGKLAFQVFLRYPNVEKIVAIELMKARYNVGVNAMKQISIRYPNIFEFEEAKDGTTVFIRFKGQNRLLEMKNMDLFEYPIDQYQKTDVLLLETEIIRCEEVKKILLNLKTGCHILSYNSFQNYGEVKLDCSCGNCKGNFHLGLYKGERFQNIGSRLTFPTTWSNQAQFHMARKSA